MSYVDKPFMLDGGPYNLDGAYKIDILI